MHTDSICVVILVSKIMIELDLSISTIIFVELDHCAHHRVCRQLHLCALHLDSVKYKNIQKSYALVGSVSWTGEFSIFLEVNHNDRGDTCLVLH